MRYSYLLKRSALQGVLKEYTFIARGKVLDLEQFCSDIFRQVVRKLDKEKKRFKTMKFQFTIQVEMSKYKLDTGEEIIIKPFFPSKLKTAVSKLELNKKVKLAFKEVIALQDNFVQCGSGWRIIKIRKLEIKVFKSDALRGGATANMLPTKLKNKNALLSIKCKDDKCFLYAVAAALSNVQKHPSRRKQYENKVSSFCTEGLTFPVSLKQIARFEDKNNLRVVVFGFENSVYPLSLGDLTKKRSVSLLLHNEHYYCIRSMSRLLFQQVTKHKGKLFYCSYCLNHFLSQYELDFHLEYCSKELQRVKTPPPRTYMHFINNQHKIPVPFVLYFDFEALNSKINQDSECEISKKTHKLTEHKAISFGVVRVCVNSFFNKPLYIYRGENAAEHFINYILNEWKEIQTIMRESAEQIQMCTADVRRFKQAKVCYICKKQFNIFRKKYRDHQHFQWRDKDEYNKDEKDSNFLGAVCRKCNLHDSSIKRRLPCIGHNISSYDLHLILQAIHKVNCGNIYVIPKSTEKFLTIAFKNIVFIDSYNFLPSSLEKIVNSLREFGTQNFSLLKQVYPDGLQQELAMRKGILCYEYLSDVDKLNEKCLPSRECFFDSLKEQHISKDEYEFAQSVFHSFHCKTIGDFLDVYLSIDCCLLADAFEAYRKLIFKLYLLDPAHYLTSSQLTLDCALLYTNAKVEIISSVDIFNFVSDGIRGGYAGAILREAHANNPFLENYDTSLRKSWIMYFDCVNMYGKQMMKKLPISDYAFVKKEKLQNIDIFTLEEFDDVGYIFDCDLSYPPHLHEETADLPLAMHKKRVKYDELSPYSTSLLNKNDMKFMSVDKLVPTLEDKTHYKVYGMNLKYYLHKGLNLKKIHAAVSFKQTPWLKPYVVFNTEQRKSSTNSFVSGIFKNLTNALFGKLLERPQNRVSFKLVTSPSQFLFHAKKPNLETVKIYNENLVGMQLKKPEVILKSPIISGFAILEYAKLELYKFHYDYVLSSYGINNAHLIYSDTDSVIYKIFSETNIYEDMFENQEIFDLSNFDINSPYYASQNKYEPGKMKDELGGQAIISVCALRSKLYSLKLKEKAIQRAKGVKESGMADISFADFQKCLHEEHAKDCKFKSIRSFDHKLYTVNSKKIAINPFEDKRFYLNATNSLPYGHFAIPDVKKAMLEKPVC